jgi:site-specific DNA recombinase
MRVLGYVRVSSAEQASSGLGLEAQRAALASYMAKLGAAIVAVFEDAGLSGGLSIEERPGLLAAVNALKKGDVLLVAKRDRLGRDVVAVALIERMVARKGARIVSTAGEGTETEDPTALLMRRIIDSFAEYERLLIGARTKAALAAKRARGERAGNVPFGFSANADGKLVDAPSERAVIAEVQRLRADGRTLRQVVRELRSQGVVGRTGRPLGLAQVHGLAHVGVAHS